MKKRGPFEEFTFPLFYLPFLEITKKSKCALMFCTYFRIDAEVPAIDEMVANEVEEIARQQNDLQMNGVGEEIVEGVRPEEEEEEGLEGLEGNDKLEGSDLVAGESEPAAPAVSE